MTEVSTTWRGVVRPGACLACGFDDGWNLDGRETIYCDCQTCAGCGDFDGHSIDCPELRTEDDQ